MEEAIDAYHSRALMFHFLNFKSKLFDMLEFTSLLYRQLKQNYYRPNGKPGERD